MIMDTLYEILFFKWLWKSCIIKKLENLKSEITKTLDIDCAHDYAKLICS